MWVIICVVYLFALFPFNKMSTQQLYLASVPNGGKNPANVFASLQNAVKEVPHIRLHAVETPALNVGTLDALMHLSDDLVKLNTQVEVCIFSVCCINHVHLISMLKL